MLLERVRRTFDEFYHVLLRQSDQKMAFLTLDAFDFDQTSGDFSVSQQYVCKNVFRPVIDEKIERKLNFGSADQMTVLTNTGI